jgi:hypothetical protein
MGSVVDKLIGGKKMLYAPELGQAPADMLIHSEHNWGSSYTVAWKVENDADVRAIFKKLRIRPSDAPTVHQPAAHLMAARCGGPAYVAGITNVAHRKLMAADLTALRTLLD